MTSVDVLGSSCSNEVDARVIASWWGIALGSIAPGLCVGVTLIIVSLLIPTAIVEMSTVAKILGAAIMMKSAIRLVVVTLTAMLARSVCLLHVVRVGLSVVTIWILSVAARRIRGIGRMVV